VPPKAQSSTFLRTRLADPAFWRAYLRAPAYDLAEAVVRLRRLRGWSQEDLAQKLATKQPGIARLESGRSNPRISTLVALGEALDATVRVSLEPSERIPSQEWFLERASNAPSTSSKVVSSVSQLPASPVGFLSSAVSTSLESSLVRAVVSSDDAVLAT